MPIASCPPNECSTPYRTPEIYEHDPRWHPLLRSLATGMSATISGVSSSAINAGSEAMRSIPLHLRKSLIHECNSMSTSGAGDRGVAVLMLRGVDVGPKGYAEMWWY